MKVRRKVQKQNQYFSLFTLKGPKVWNYVLNENRFQSNPNANPVPKETIINDNIEPESKVVDEIPPSDQ